MGTFREDIARQLRSLQVHPAGTITIRGLRVTRSAIYWYVNDSGPLGLDEAVHRIAVEGKPEQRQ